MFFFPVYLLIVVFHIHVYDWLKCRVVVSVSTSWSRDIPTSHLGLVSRKIVNVSVSGGRRLGLVSVSAIYLSCPRPVFGQIVQATLIKRVSFNGVWTGFRRW